MLTAISSGVWAPISSPTGVMTLSRWLSIKAFLFQGLQQGLPFAPAPQQADEAGLGCQAAPHGSEILHDARAWQ